MYLFAHFKTEKCGHTAHTHEKENRVRTFVRTHFSRAEAEEREGDVTFGEMEERGKKERGKRKERTWWYRATGLEMRQKSRVKNSPSICWHLVLTSAWVNWSNAGHLVNRTIYYHFLFYLLFPGIDEFQFFLRFLLCVYPLPVCSTLHPKPFFSLGAGSF